MSAKWFLLQARSLDSLILEDSATAQASSYQHAFALELDKCHTNCLEAHKAVEYHRTFLITLLRQTQTPSRMDLLSAILQTQRLLSLFESSSEALSRIVRCQSEVRESKKLRLARLRVYSEVGVKCAELLGASRSRSQRSNEKQSVTQIQKVSQHSNGRRIDQHRKITWKQCYLDTEKVRQDLLEQLFARTMYHRITTVKVRDLLLETAEAMLPFNTSLASAYTGMAQELTYRTASDTWSCRHPGDADIQRALEETILDLGKLFKTQDFACMDLLGLSAADVTRLHGIFDDYALSVQEAIGAHMLQSAAHNHRSTSSHAEKETSNKRKRRLNAACHGSAARHPQWWRVERSDNKIYVSERLWASVVCADALANVYDGEFFEQTFASAKTITATTTNLYSDQDLE